MQWFLERIFQKEGINQRVIRLSDKPLLKKIREYSKSNKS